MHSWPITVFAPISTRPSWQRILVLSPIQTKRPNSIRPLRADLQFQPAAEEESPSVRQRRPARGEEAPPQVADESCPYLRFSIPLRARKRIEADHGGEDSRLTGP